MIDFFINVFFYYYLFIYFFFSYNCIWLYKKINKNEHAIGVQLLPVNIIYWTQNYSSSLKLNSTRKNKKKDNNIMHVA